MPVSDLYRAPPNLDLKKVKTDNRVEGSDTNNKDADKALLQILTERIADYQNVLYAGKQHKLLIVLQGMDTSGKDGTIRGVFGAINPLGTRTVAFKAPNNHEKEHDYLWRIHREVPGNGEIVLFNRSHYEDVLVTRVHDWIDQKECERRYKQIENFERLLAETGTVILKFLLHISKEEQKKRLEERTQDPKKQWKYDPQDLTERAHWQRYQELYAAAINETNADYAPWYIIPADSKTKRNLAIAQIVVEKLESLKLSYPPPNPALSKIKIE